MALQGFGGVLAVVQRELVEKKCWLSREEFVEEWAVAQALPGPNVVNLSLIIGGRHFGWRGGLAALAGLIALPCTLAFAVMALFSSVANTGMAHSALRGMSAVVAGLVIATGLKLIPALKQNPLGFYAGLAISAITFVLAALLHWPLAVTLLLLGLPSCVWAWFQIKDHL